MRSVRRFERALKVLNPDCVVSFGPDPLVYMAMRLVRYQGGLVCCERGYLGARNAAYQWILKREMASADCGVFQFDGAKDPYGSSLPEDCRVIPNPCVRRTEAKRAPGALTDEIVGAGRLVPDKGFATLVEAFSLISQDVPDAHLTIYGEGPDRHRLEELVSSLGLAERISLPGAVSNVAEASINARLFVLASEYEGCPNVLIEAMCAGIPVVAADCRPGGARFLTENGHIGGPLVPVDDAKLMARAIREMLANPKEAERLGALGETLLDKYSYEAVMAKWIETFADVLGDQRKENLRSGGRRVAEEAMNG